MYLALTALLLLSSNDVNDPQQTIVSEPNLKDTLIIGAEFIPALFIDVVIHESGHVLVSKLLGVGVEEFTVYPSRCGDGIAFGCVALNAKDYYFSTKKEKIAIAAGSIITTRIMSESLDALMNNANFSPRLNQFGAVLYFTTRLDAIRYILSCSIRSWLDINMDNSYDPQAIVGRISDRKSEQKWIYLGLVSIATIDLLLDIDELKTNWNRLWIE